MKVANLKANSSSSQRSLHALPGLFLYGALVIIKQLQLDVCLVLFQIQNHTAIIHVLVHVLCFSIH